MYSALVLGLFFPLLYSSSLPRVLADCSSENFDNCASCYQTVANAIVNTADNKYEISRAFFPAESVTSVHVRVTYRSESNANSQITYFWVMGGFYVIQPLNVFLYRSLFFSPPSYRQENVTIMLPDRCFNDLANSNEEFFKFATQRVWMLGFFYLLLIILISAFLFS